VVTGSIPVRGTTIINCLYILVSTLLMVESNKVLSLWVEGRYNPSYGREQRGTLFLQEKK
tara:strand:+ start:163 stop:342 length:180 start_codon:yes stop_codon:yes gene_type:complete